MGLPTAVTATARHCELQSARQSPVRQPQRPPSLPRPALQARAPRIAVACKRATQSKHVAAARADGPSEILPPQARPCRSWSDAAEVLSEAVVDCSSASTASRPRAADNSAELNACQLQELMDEVMAPALSSDFVSAGFEAELVTDTYDDMLEDDLEERIPSPMCVAFSFMADDSQGTMLPVDQGSSFMMVFSGKQPSGSVDSRARASSSSGCTNTLDSQPCSDQAPAPLFVAFTQLDSCGAGELLSANNGSSMLAYCASIKADDTIQGRLQKSAATKPACHEQLPAATANVAAAAPRKKCRPPAPLTALTEEAVEDVPQLPPAPTHSRKAHDCFIEYVCDLLDGALSGKAVAFSLSQNGLDQSPSAEEQIESACKERPPQLCLELIYDDAAAAPLPPAVPGSSSRQAFRPPRLSLHLCEEISSEAPEQPTVPRGNFPKNSCLRGPANLQMELCEQVADVVHEPPTVPKSSSRPARTLVKEEREAGVALKITSSPERRKRSSASSTAPPLAPGASQAKQKQKGTDSRVSLALKADSHKLHRARSLGPEGAPVQLSAMEMDLGQHSAPTATRAGTQSPRSRAQLSFAFATEHGNACLKSKLPQLPAIASAANKADAAAWRLGMNLPGELLRHNAQSVF